MKKFLALVTVVLAVTTAVPFMAWASETKDRGVLHDITFMADETPTITPTPTAAPIPTATPTPTAIPTPTPKPIPKNVLKKEGSKYYYYDSKGKKVKNKWLTIKGKRYYFKSDCSAATYSYKVGSKLYVFNTKGQLVKPSKKSLVNVGKYTYYVSTGGTAYTGWQVISNKLYYANSKGQIYKSRTYQGVTFTSKGYAKDNTESRLKMKVMSIVSSITKPSQTKSQKLYACWRYVISNTRYTYRYPNIYVKGWQKAEALQALNTKTGNCYGFACAFAALANEIGYDPYVVCGRVAGSRDGAADGLTRHSWVKINGYHYDPEAQYAGWLSGVYGYSYYPCTHTIQKLVNFAIS